jgi:hypothetical protein
MSRRDNRQVIDVADELEKIAKELWGKDNGRLLFAIIESKDEVLE